jgi:hypothetical protein
MASHSIQNQHARLRSTQSETQTGAVVAVHSLLRSLTRAAPHPVWSYTAETYTFQNEVLRIIIKFPKETATSYYTNKVECHQRSRSWLRHEQRREERTWILALGGLHVKQAVATRNLGTNWSICCRTDENHGKPWSSWPVEGPSGWKLTTRPYLCCCFACTHTHTLTFVTSLNNFAENSRSASYWSSSK